jgi:hypothetical protein
MSRTIEIAFDAGHVAHLPPGPPRRDGEIVQSLEITGIEPQYVGAVEVACSNCLVFQTPAFNGGLCMAYLANEMGLGYTMTVQFHAAGAVLAKGAGIERMEPVRVMLWLNAHAPKDALPKLVVTLEKARYKPDPFFCLY